MVSVSSAYLPSICDKCDVKFLRASLLPQSDVFQDTVTSELPAAVVSAGPSRLSLLQFFFFFAES